MNVHELACRHTTLKLAAQTKGGEYVGPCPGCGGRDRFHVWPADKGGDGSYWCRGCGSAGDGIQFLMDFEGRGYREACAILGIDAPDGGAVPQRTSPRRREQPAFAPKAYANPADAWAERAAKLVTESQDRLAGNASAVKWLASRGIDMATAERFRLGWIDENIFRPRAAWGLDDILKPNGKKKMLFIPRGILIPSLSGESVFRLRVRRPKADINDAQNQKKYYVVPGSAPMALVAGADAKAFVIVETELDAMMLHGHAGDMIGAVAMGSSSTKPDERCHAMLAKAACILVALDFDKAGRDAWIWWRDTYPDAERWPVPDGKDPGEAFERGVDMRAWLLAGLPPAWHVAAHGRKRRSAPPVDVPAVDPVTQVEAAETVDAAETVATVDSRPESVQALRGMLTRYPIRIRATEKNIKLLPAKHFNNDAVMKEISRMVFMDGPCLEYLLIHPAEIVDGRNFDAGVK